MHISELETPCLILDRKKLERNIKKMKNHLAQIETPIRPHAKTSKNIEIVKLAIEGQPGGITVSTLKEAEYFFEKGIIDILYAVGIAPVKLDHIAALVKRGADIKIILDTVEQAKAAIEKARDCDVNFGVLIELDSDGHRSGVGPDDPLLFEIARVLHDEPGVELRGVLTHAGGSYNCKTVADIQRLAAQERDTAANCASRLRRAGLPCSIVSIGSTPTARFSENLSGVTEVRAGVYMFYDLVMVRLGVCEIQDIALSVLASVVGHQKRKGWVIVDAGWMALSLDRGIAGQEMDQGYGLVCNIDGEPLIDVAVTMTNQEHGIVTKLRGDGLDFDDFPIGSLIRVLPNHACATGAMHDRYYVVDGTTEVVDMWPRVNGY